MLAVKAWFNSSESRNIWAIELRRRHFVDNKIAFCYPQNALKIIHGTQKTSRPSVILSRSRKTTTADSRPFACRNTLNSPVSRSFFDHFFGRMLRNISFKHKSGGLKNGTHKQEIQSLDGVL